MGTIPVTVYKPATDSAAPVVVIAHGFAGSQQLMQPFAVTLARNGYVAVTFDFPGHGRNATPLPGGFEDHVAITRALLKALDSVTGFFRAFPAGDGRIALLGHSMASDIVVRYAQAHRDVAATVAVSLFFPDATAEDPRNLLIIDGALEPGMLKEEAYRIVGLVTAGRPQERVTYGSFANGSARRLAFAGGVEHIGVIYSRESMVEALDWLNQAFGRKGAGFVDARAPWLGALFLGLVMLAWPLARLLPRVAPQPLGAGYRWRRLLPVAVAPALLTPLILWKLPTDFLPLLLGDYLLLHFGLYGLITAITMIIAGRSIEPGARSAVNWRAFAIALSGAIVYGVFAMGFVLDAYFTNFVPVPGRVPLILAMLCGTLPYFISDEWLTRGASAPRGAYPVTKFFFLISLVLAVALNLQKLFFLAIIVPAILILFVVYGLFSRWIYRGSNHPLAAAVANAVFFAWFIAITFPVVNR